jgi:hypothetical protein
MQATTPGQNRTGTTINPESIDMMLEAVDDLSPPVPISTAPIDAERLRYIAEADSVGSIPPPRLLKGAVKKAMAVINGVNPAVFLDKIGERIAFERTGTRLYDALISKYVALQETGGADFTALNARQPGNGNGASIDVDQGETPLQTLRRIRDEEHSHFLMLCEVMLQLGGDPTAQTPCADVAGTATMGVLQVVTDPRTTLAQCLNAALIAELTDTASWELLCELATAAGQSDFAERCNVALAEEQLHLQAVRSWLRTLTLEASGTSAV